MEMTQYQKDLVRMWDSLRIENKGANNCHPIKCKLCPLETVCPKTSIHALFNIGKIIEIVTQWAKEHPIMTNVDKYREVFGVEPKKQCGAFVCPRSVGFANVVSCNPNSCERCKREFWNSEYIEPKKKG